MMAKENQAVTSELTRLGAERDDRRRQLGDALHNQTTAEQVLQMLPRLRITFASARADLGISISTWV